MATPFSLVGTAPKEEVVTAPTAVLTKAVVAICSVLVPAFAVGALGVPVKVGDALGARGEIAEYTVPPVTKLALPLATEPLVMVTSSLPEVSERLIPDVPAALSA